MTLKPLEGIQLRQGSGVTTCNLTQECIMICHSAKLLNFPASILFKGIVAVILPAQFSSIRMPELDQQMGQQYVY